MAVQSMPSTNTFGKTNHDSRWFAKQLSQKMPHRSGALSDTNILDLMQFLFNAFLGKFGRSSDRSGNRILHLVAGNCEISLLFCADPARPRAALNFHSENFAIRAYRISAEARYASLHDSLVFVRRYLHAVAGCELGKVRAPSGARIPRLFD